MSESPRAARIRVGQILLGSAVLMGVLAILFFAGIVPIAEESRTMLALVVGGAAVMDVVLALYFMNSDPS